jgi:UDP-N-acetylmuramate--alanine ligase
LTRTAAELGQGLAPVRAARPIRPGERIHVVGVAGAGASAAALLAHGAGAIVSGCDSGGPSPYTPAVEAAGIPIAWGHDPSHVTGDPRPDRLAVTKALTSIDPDNPELASAQASGIPAEPWQQVVADAAVGKTLVAVAGTHGKSTTAGWLTHVLVSAGKDPSAFVGALLPPSITGGQPATARLGRGSIFVVEADEYAGNFDAFRPDLALVTNIDWDHPDLFRDRREVVDAVAAWLQRGQPDVVAFTGDEGVTVLLERLGNSTAVIKTAIDASTDTVDLSAHVVEQGIARTRVTFDVIFGGSFTADLQPAGMHNVANASVVAGAAIALLLSLEEIAQGLATFAGVGRRLERKGEAAGVAVYDDYGHHPTAIRATLEAVRQREPGRRVWAVYEPLTYHRTAALLSDFAEVLATADAVAIADVWAGRDPDTTVASAGMLAEAIRVRAAEIGGARIVGAPGSVEGTAAWLAERVEPGDVVLVMGGGRSYRIAELLLELLLERPTPSSVPDRR